MNANFATRHFDAGCQPNRRCLLDARVTHNPRFIGATNTRRPRGRNLAQPSARTNPGPARPPPYTPAAVGVLRTITLPVVPGTAPFAGAASSTGASWHAFADIKPTNFPHLADLLTQYSRVTFTSMTTEVICCGAETSARQLWYTWAADTSPHTQNIQELPNARFASSRSGLEHTDPAPMPPYSPHLMPTQRQSTGAALRLWTNDKTPWTNADFVVRVRCVMLCADPIEA